MSLIMHANKFNRMRDADTVTELIRLNYTISFLSPLSSFLRFICVCLYCHLLLFCPLQMHCISTLKTTYNSLYFYFPIKPSLFHFFVYNHEAKHVMMPVQHIDITLISNTILPSMASSSVLTFLLESLMALLQHYLLASRVHIIYIHHDVIPCLGRDIYARDNGGSDLVHTIKSIQFRNSVDKWSF
eukprot:567455_1